jgi:hypothetical protein
LIAQSWFSPQCGDRPAERHTIEIGHSQQVARSSPMAKPLCTLASLKAASQCCGSLLRTGARGPAELARARKELGLQVSAEGTRDRRTNGPARQVPRQQDVCSDHSLVSSKSSSRAWATRPDLFLNWRGGPEHSRNRTLNANTTRQAAWVDRRWKTDDRGT